MIGHEITHGCDGQRRRFDAAGVLRDWWTPADARRFQAEAAKLVRRYDAFEPLPGVHPNGAQTLGEAIADLGGLSPALDAYHASVHGRPAPVVDGLTGDPRAFLGWAQARRTKAREDTTRGLIATDVHSPPRFRVDGPTRNMDAWSAAFQVDSTNTSHLWPDQRSRVW